MAGKYLDDVGLSELWEKIQNRSLPVKFCTAEEFFGMTSEQMNRDIVFIVDSGNGDIVLLYHNKEIVLGSENILVRSKNFKATNLKDALEELFTSVSNGKKMIASAITDKDIPTKEDATFEEMAKNIADISTMPDGIVDVNVVSSNEKRGTVSGSGMATKGMEIHISSVPKADYFLFGWKENKRFFSYKNDDIYMTVPESNTSIVGDFINRSFNFDQQNIIINSIARSNGETLSTTNLSSVYFYYTQLSRLTDSNVELFHQAYDKILTADTMEMFLNSLPTDVVSSISDQFDAQRWQYIEEILIGGGSAQQLDFFEQASLKDMDLREFFCLQSNGGTVQECFDNGEAVSVTVALNYDTKSDERTIAIGLLFSGEKWYAVPISYRYGSIFFSYVTIDNLQSPGIMFCFYLIR